MDIRRRVLVSGVVQGVGYRDTCRHVAHRLGVRGWVGNRADGRVEAVMEGPPDAVTELIEWCRDGPRFASVTSVEVSTEEPSSEGPFRIVI